MRAGRTSSIANSSAISGTTDAGARLTLTVPQLAAELNVAESTAWKLVAEGVIPSVKLAGSRRIVRAELERALAELTEVG